ncbi:MAG TPA: 5-formyltetrahydrofolate cyclo-ligase [Pseudolabrys sp.]|nr:5-formyltetrahydrofolate cyclo-ligase [Pseudolabrys sp.]
MTEFAVNPELSISSQKSTLRAATLAQRDAMPAAERQAAAEALAARGLPIAVEPGAIVSGFMPMKTEINPLPLLRKLAGEGAKLALPCIDGRGKPLIMRAYQFGDTFKSGQWGIREPMPEAPEVKPDILLVPLVCFDRGGQRIGYGAGYYDRTIANLRAIKPIKTIGIAFAMQEIPQVPATEHDQRLDFVLTEKEIIAF